MSQLLSILLSIFTAIATLFGLSMGESEMPIETDIPELYSAEDIQNDPCIFGIGATKSSYVVAVFNEDFSEVVIQANGKNSDCLMADFENPNCKDSASVSPMVVHKGTLISSVIGENVKNIGDYAFYYCQNLSGFLELPDSIETIGKSSFQNTEITGIDFGDGVKEIKTKAFYCIKSLTGDLKLDGTTEFIGDSAFSSTSVTGLYFGDKVGFIGTAAFQKCSSIENEILFPDSLFVIGDFAFNHLYNAANSTLYIPQKLAHIGGTSVNKPDISTLDGNTFGEISDEDYEPNGYTVDNYRTARYADSGTHTFYRFGENRNLFGNFVCSADNEYFCTQDGVLYSKDGKRLVFCPTYYNRDLVIADGCETADELSLNRVTNVTLPDSFRVMPFTQAPVTQINYQNTLEDALYRTGICASVFVKSTNSVYKSVNGSLYSLDGKICYHLKFNDGVAEVEEGCEVLEGLYIDVAGAKSLLSDNVKELKIIIPATVKLITNYDSKTFPGEGYIDSINKVVNSGVPLTMCVDKNNMHYKTDKANHLIFVS